MPKKQKVFQEPEVKREPGLEEEEKEPQSEAHGVAGGDIVAAALVASNKALVASNTLLCAQAFADLERERVAEVAKSHLRAEITRLQTELAKVKARVADRAERVIGKGGIGSGEFNAPRFIAFDDEGNLVVSDCHNHRIQVLRYPDGLHLRTIGSKGEGNGQFMHPWGIAFDRLGHLVVADACNRRVQVLRYRDGVHVRNISSFGNGEEQLQCPCDVAIDPEGNIVVNDSQCYETKGRIQVFRMSDGTHMRSMCRKGHGEGQLHGASCIAFDDEGNLVVSDCHNHRIQVLRYPDGLHLRTIGSRVQGEGNGQFTYPRGINFDRLGHLVVADTCNHRVQVLRYNDGALVRSIGSFGNGAGQLNGPFCAIFDGDGRMVVCDHHNHRVVVCAQ